MFIVAHYVGSGLTSILIFACLEVLFSFKYAMEMLSISLEEYYTGMIVFKRFADVFNIDQRTMVRIEEQNKKNTK